MPLEQLEDRSTELPQGKEVLVYCRLDEAGKPLEGTEVNLEGPKAGEETQDLPGWNHSPQQLASVAWGSLCLPLIGIPRHGILIIVAITGAEFAGRASPLRSGDGQRRGVRLVGPRFSGSLET